MTTNEHVTVIAAFNDLPDAQKALDLLRVAGFRPDQIGIATPEKQIVQEGVYEPGKNETIENSTTGAIAGGAIGGLLGAAVATALLPGFGPIVVGGLLAGIGTGAICGIRSTGFVKAAMDIGIPEEEARLYEREMIAGNTIVIVRSSEHFTEASDILRRAGAHDVHAPVIAQT
jgi:hypothetical protein